MSNYLWLILVLILLGTNFCHAKYKMGCDCGEREISEEQEKECEDSALLDNEKVDYHHVLVAEIFIKMIFYH